MEEKKTNINCSKKSTILIVLYCISVFFLILTIISVIYVMCSNDETYQNVIKAGNLSIELKDAKNTNINLVDALPTKDENAVSLKPYEFKVTNTGTLTVIYRIKLIDAMNNELEEKYQNYERLSHDKIKYSLIEKNTKNIVKTGFISELEKEIILKEKLEPMYSVEYEFRIWLSENIDNNEQNKIYAGRVLLEIDETKK